MLVGGGFEDFTNNTMQNMTGTAGIWNARCSPGRGSIFGGEAAYVGAARSIDALGLQSNAVLVANGVEGDARLNVPVVMRRAQLLEPFGFVGVGWQHYQVTNTNTFTSDLARDDDIMARAGRRRARSTRSAASWRTRASPTARRTTTICW